MKAINLTKRAMMLMVVATATIMATLTGCGTKDDPDGDPIDGTWTATYSGVTFTLDINAGAGTYLFSANSGESESGAYDPKTGNMTSSDGESFYKVKYNKSNDTLTLTDDDGIKVVFDRVGGKKEEVTVSGEAAKFVGTWTITPGYQILYSKVNGKWVENTGDIVRGFRFFSDGTFWEMFAFYREYDIGYFHNKEYQGDMIYYGKYSIKGSQLFLSNVRYDFIAKDKEDSEFGSTSDDKMYYFSFGVDKRTNKNALFLSKVYQDPDEMEPHFRVN